MKVLVLGLPRTGTQSLADALEVLGITPAYHMREVPKNQDHKKWISALQAKFEGGDGRLDRAQFDNILGSYEAVTDYPASIFPTELLAAYPSAKVILTTRSEDSWYESMLRTVWHGHVNAPPDNIPVKDSLRKTFHLHCWDNDFPRNGRALFNSHNELVKEAAKNREFLEYRPGDGWEPLCQFLGVDVPERAYPHSDDFAEYKAAHQHEDEVSK